MNIACFNGAAHLRERKRAAGGRHTEGHRASMEPLTCVSGNAQFTDAGVGAGAASMEPLTCVSGNVDDAALPGAKRLASMEPLTCVSGNRHHGGGAEREHQRFNGAAHLRERKRADVLHVARGQRASMEPLTCVSGNTRGTGEPEVWRLRFNGAAHLRERKRTCGSRDRCGTWCFNGAAHLRERKRQQDDAADAAARRLQWSRSPA